MNQTASVRVGKEVAEGVATAIANAEARGDQGEPLELAFIALIATVGVATAIAGNACAAGCLVRSLFILCKDDARAVHLVSLVAAERERGRREADGDAATIGAAMLLGKKLV